MLKFYEILSNKDENITLLSELDLLVKLTVLYQFISSASSSLVRGANFLNTTLLISLNNIANPTSNISPRNINAILYF